MSRAFTATAAANRIHSQLVRTGNQLQAEKMKRFFKPEEHDSLIFHGVLTPTLREMARDFHDEYGGKLKTAEVVDLSDACVKNSYQETKITGILCLGKWKRHFSSVPTLLTSIRSWLDADLLNNWALTDSLCGEVVTHCLQDNEAKKWQEELLMWSTSQSIWTRRASAVALVGHARRGKHIPFALQISENLVHEDHDILQKALGWLLKEASKGDRKSVHRFLLKHNDDIPKVALRIAIEKLPAGDRKKYLARQADTVKVPNSKT